MQNIKLSEVRSFSNSPPLSLEEVVQKVKELYNHRGDHQNHTTKLCLEEYRLLIKHINNDPDFLLNILNTRVSAQTQDFVLKMPSKIHECFAGKVREDLKSQIQQLRQEFLQVPQVTKFCDDLESDGSPDFHSKDGNSSKSPDIHITHRRAKFPAIIVEVAHTQTQRSLSKLAKSYFQEYKGNIQMVIGLSTEYHGQEATVNVWQTVRNQSNIVNQAHIVQDQVFRNNDETAVAGSFLRIPWTVFNVPGHFTIPVEIRHQEMIISNTKLTEYLNRAEAYEADGEWEVDNELASDSGSDDITEKSSSFETHTDSSDKTFDPTS